MLSRICRHCKEEFELDLDSGKPGFIDECPSCLNWSPPSHQKPIDFSSLKQHCAGDLPLTKKKKVMIGPLPKSPRYGTRAPRAVRLSKKERRKRRKNARRLLRKNEKSKISCKEKHEFANQMRANMTNAEQYIWPDLKKLGFLAQEVIFGYIPDFYHPVHLVVVEVDGDYHSEQKQKIYDKRKDDYLKSKYIKVLRFKNEEVFRHLEKVLLEIRDTLMIT